MNNGAEEHDWRWWRDLRSRLLKPEYDRRVSASKGKRPAATEPEMSWQEWEELRSRLPKPEYDRRVSASKGKRPAANESETSWTKGKEQPVPGRRGDAGMRAVPLALRYQVLERDRARCCACGRGPHDRATLHVDHIVPRSLGGPTSLENLQALCADCNLGKGNRASTDYRAR